jgi:hypothetical protein
MRFLLIFVPETLPGNFEKKESCYPSKEEPRFYVATRSCEEGRSS